MSWNDAGYGAAGGWRQSSAATITPLLASGSWITLSASRSERHHAPPCSSTMMGNGPAPCGRDRRARNGEIGRAACRGRGEISVGAVSFKKKKENKQTDDRR